MSQRIYTYDPVEGLQQVGAGVPVDDAMSTTSSNPVQNKVVTAEINKAYKEDDTAETNIVDGDYIPFYDTSAGGKRKSLWSNIIAKIKSALATVATSGSYTDLSDKPTIPTIQNVLTSTNASVGLSANMGNSLGAMMAPIVAGPNYPSGITKKGDQFVYNGRLCVVTANTVSTSTAINVGSGGNASYASSITSQISDLNNSYKAMVLGLYLADTPIPLVSPSSLVGCPNVLHSGSAEYVTKTSDGGIRILKGGVIVVNAFISIKDLNAGDDVEVYSLNYNNGSVVLTNSSYYFEAGFSKLTGFMFWVTVCNANDIIYLRARNLTSASRGSIEQARLMASYL